MEVKKCSEIYNADLLFEFTNENLFIKLGTLINGDSFSWVNEELRDMFEASEGAKHLSLDYFLNRQDRYMSSLYMQIYNYNDDLATTNNNISMILITKYLKGWSKLADAVFGDYNPIENYRMVENKETDFEEHTVTDNDETVTNKYSGFNTDTMKDVSESTTDGTIDTTKTDTGSKAKNELTRSGNIGVTTSQQMIESSFNLAKKNLLDIIYKDIDTILFMDYYF